MYWTLAESKKKSKNFTYLFFPGKLRCLFPEKTGREKKNLFVYEVLILRGVELCYARLACVGINGVTGDSFRLCDYRLDRFLLFRVFSLFGLGPVSALDGLPRLTCLLLRWIYYGQSGRTCHVWGFFLLWSNLFSIQLFQFFFFYFFYRLNAKRATIIVTK